MGHIHPRSPIAIIGAGLGGIAAAVGLQRAGFTNFTIFEKSEQPGGTWYDNTFPGAACDIPSVLYSYSFRPGDWASTHGTQREILSYIGKVVDENGLRPHLRLGVEVTSVTWNSDSATHTVVLGGGEREQFSLVIAALGQLSNVKYPEWPGLDDFEGEAFHTARWPTDVDLQGKSVAVVGTGSTSAQVVPAIAPKVANLLVFQREPAWVVPKVHEVFDESTRRHLRKTWVQRVTRAKTFLRHEHQRRSIRPGSRQQQRQKELALEQLRVQVPDPKLRSLLTPSYDFFCKRPVFSSEFYPALTRSNVELVPRSVERVTPRGVVDSEGVEHEVDVIVMATGFQPTRFLATLDVRGEGGARFADVWGEDPESVLGIATAGFPNFFMLYGPNSNGGSIIFVLERQVEAILRVLRRMAKRRAAVVKVDGASTTRLNERMQGALQASVYAGSCHSYFRSASGRVVTQWPYSSTKFWLMSKWVSRRFLTLERDGETSDAFSD
jgi:cation diffusion facilitator CzcD-associated flavoprotein CzcO